MTSAGQPAPMSAALLDACREHLAFVRDRCPGLLPSAPLPPGRPAEPIPVEPRAAGRLAAVAARQAAAEDGARATVDDLPRAIVWESGADALLVLLDTVTVDTDDGVVRVGVDVACGELRAAVGAPRARVRVDLVVGTAARPTGMLAAAPPPHGPLVVVQRWADELVAFAWQALLDTATGLAASSGTDTDGVGLVPTTWSASAAGLLVEPQARHPRDRRVSTAVRP